MEDTKLFDALSYLSIQNRNIDYYENYFALEYIFETLILIGISKKYKTEF